MEIERARLLESIGRVLPAVARREAQGFEQATKVVLRGGCVAAYNDEVSVVDRLDALGDLEGAVDGRQLHALLSKMTGDAVTLSVDGSRLALRSGRVRAAFDLLPVVLPIDEATYSPFARESAELPGDFSRRLLLVAGSCARELDRPVLTCVSLSGDAMEAADGYRAARLEVEGASLPELLLPASAAAVAARYDVSRVAASESGEWARLAARGGGTTLYARVFSGRFPDLAGLYHVEGVAVVLPEALRRVLERASVFTEREHRIDEQVGVSLRPNQVTVSASYDGGEFTEVVRTDQQATADFSIHPAFLAEVLRAGTSCVVGGDRVLFSGTGWQHVIALR